jgi:thymidylate kinase
MSDRSTVAITFIDAIGTRMAFELRPGMSVAIIGADGTGKSTAARMLAERLQTAGIACRRHHWYRWHQAMFSIPAAVVLNRWRRDRVQIFDRTIYDNIATWALGRRSRRHAAAMVRAARAIVPRFDVAIFLAAPPDLVVERRPEISKEDAEIAAGIYSDIGDALGVVPLDRIRIAE